MKADDFGFEEFHIMKMLRWCILEAEKAIKNRRDIRQGITPARGTARTIKSFRRVMAAPLLLQH
jgi:hypothetical protein